MKKKTVKKKGVVDLTDPENKYVLKKISELTPDLLIDDKFRKNYCNKARLEFRLKFNFQNNKD